MGLRSSRHHNISEQAKLFLGVESRALFKDSCGGLRLLDKGEVNRSYGWHRPACLFSFVKHIIVNEPTTLNSFQ